RAAAAPLPPPHALQPRALGSARRPQSARRVLNQACPLALVVRQASAEVASITGSACEGCGPPSRTSIQPRLHAQAWRSWCGGQPHTLEGIVSTLDPYGF